MTPRPEDVETLLNAASAAIRGFTYNVMRASRREHLTELADRLDAFARRLAEGEVLLASRLEGEGRDGERCQDCDHDPCLRLTDCARCPRCNAFLMQHPNLRGARPCSNPECSYELPAPASSPQPTTTTEEHKP